MNKRQLGLILFLGFISLVGGPGVAENRFVTQEAVDMVEQRQDTMARMLEAAQDGRWDGRRRP